VLSLADAIAVMYRGKIVGTVSPDTSREEIGLLMAGITENGAAAVGEAPEQTAVAAPDHDGAEAGTGHAAETGHDDETEPGPQEGRP
jgi:simple sugar transport system ATP-binding protein